MTDATLLLIGGTSDIGFATARRFAAAGWSVTLAARNLEAAERNAADLRIAGAAGVDVRHLDVTECDSFPAFVAALGAVPDAVVCSVGELGKDAETKGDLTLSRRVIDSNYTGPALLLGLIGDRMAARGSGVIVGISSVAGERGRRGNYLYGSAKAGFTAYLSGLRSHLLGRGVRVVSILPGFVDTSMTAGMDLPKPLTAKPDEVAARIYRAVDKAGGEVVYVKPVWRLVMAIIKAIPEPIFKKMSI